MTQKEYINSAVEEFASLFIEKLETMEKAQWQKPWFTQGALRLPENLRGTGYNGSNSIMLMFCQEKEGYKFPIWGTFKQFIELTPKGSSTPVCVNKGEHSIPVLYTSFTVIDKDAHTKIPFEEFKRLSESEKSKYAIYPRLSVYRVFNLDQTNLASACPEKFAEITARFARTDVPNRDMDNYTITELDAMLSAQRWVCPINLKYQDRAYYHTSEDIIVLPEREQFCDNESFYGTLLHEMTHSTGIGTRLARYPEVSRGIKSGGVQPRRAGRRTHGGFHPLPVRSGYVHQERFYRVRPVLDRATQGHPGDYQGHPERREEGWGIHPGAHRFRAITLKCSVDMDIIAAAYLAGFEPSSEHQTSGELEAEATEYLTNLSS